jgi:hypothetical protein
MEHLTYLHVLDVEFFGKDVGVPKYFIFFQLYKLQFEHSVQNQFQNQTISTHKHYKKLAF